MAWRSRVHCWRSSLWVEEAPLARSSPFTAQPRCTSKATARLISVRQGSAVTRADEAVESDAPSAQAQSALVSVRVRRRPRRQTADIRVPRSRPSGRARPPRLHSQHHSIRKSQLRALRTKSRSLPVRQLPGSAARRRAHPPHPLRPPHPVRPPHPTHRPLPLTLNASDGLHRHWSTQRPSNLAPATRTPHFRPLATTSSSYPRRRRSVRPGWKAATTSS